VKKCCKSVFLFLRKNWTDIQKTDVKTFNEILSANLKEEQVKFVLKELNKKKKKKNRGGFKKFLSK